MLDQELDDLTKDLFPHQSNTALPNFAETLNNYHQRNQNTDAQQKAEQLMKQVTVTSDGYDIDEDVNVKIPDSNCGLIWLGGGV